MKYIIIQDWNGGLAEGEKRGTLGSFKYGLGLDYKSNPDAITGELALVNDSGSTVTDLIKGFTFDSVQNDLYAVGDTGKIYKKDNLTTWSLLQTTSSCTGLGLEVFNDHLFYTQATQMGNYGTLSGTPTFDNDYKTSITPGSLKAFLNYLLVGNGRYLATLDDAGVWEPTRLTFPPGWNVQDIEVRGEYAAIAVNNASTLAKATRGIVFYWDGTSHAYNNFYEVMDGGGISSIQGNQDSLWIFAGHKGNIYIDTSRNTKVKKIPFVGRGQTSYVYPSASDNFGGMLVFGPGAGTSTGVYKGIYEYGQSDKDQSLSLNLSYPLSCGVKQGTGLEIGAIFALGPQIYVSWKNDATYGVDLLSTSIQQTSVVHESLRASFDSRRKIQRVAVCHDPLLTGESITVKYKADKSASWVAYDAPITYVVGDGQTRHILNTEFSANDLEIQLTLAGSTTMPSVHKVIIECDEEGVI